MFALLWRALTGLALAAAACGAFAAESNVPYVPTPQEVVDKMLAMARVTPNDYLIDLGSGDGRIVVTAVRKYGARGFGVDLNPQRIREAVENALQNGVSDRTAFYQRNLFETDLSSASVITMYLLPRVNMALRPRLLDLRPGTRIVSHDFDMDDWKADETVHMDVREKYGSSSGTSSIYFYIVPAKVSGLWRWQQTADGVTNDYELALEQKFQVLSGTVRVNGSTYKITDASLRGDQLAFNVVTPLAASTVKQSFAGRVSGEQIFGSVALSGPRAHSQTEWLAARVVKTGALETAPLLLAVY